MALQTKRIIRGTYGELWLDGDKVSEAYGLDARIEVEKEDVPVCGKLGTDTRIVGYKGTGSIKLHKTSSRMGLLLGEAIKNGEEPRFQLLSKLADPTAWGAERILIKDVSFDDLTLANWEAKTRGSVDCPFTFTDYEFLDTITPRD